MEPKKKVTLTVSVNGQRVKIRMAVTNWRDSEMQIRRGLRKEAARNPTRIVHLRGGKAVQMRDINFIQERTATKQEGRSTKPRRDRPSTIQVTYHPPMGPPMTVPMVVRPLHEGETAQDRLRELHELRAHLDRLEPYTEKGKYRHPATIILSGGREHSVDMHHLTLPPVDPREPGSERISYSELVPPPKPTQDPQVAA